MKILITGATGYVGRALTPKLEALYGKESIFALDSKTFSTLNDTFDYYPNIDFIIHLAVKTHAGDYCKVHQGEQFLINSEINNKVLQYWKKHQPQAHFITFGSSCGYDNDVVKTPQNYFEGMPEEGYETYGYLKRHLLVGLGSLNTEYGMTFDYLIPSTIYGPGYDLKDKHFIFDLIRKITDRSTLPTLWGTGEQKRDLIYIDDVVNVIIKKIQKHILSENKTWSIDNLCSGEALTIKRYAKNICRIVDRDFKDIQWDVDKHVGTFDKTMVKTLPYPVTSPTTGLKKTVEYYLDEFHKTRIL